MFQPGCQTLLLPPTTILINGLAKNTLPWSLVSILEGRVAMKKIRESLAREPEVKVAIREEIDPNMPKRGLSRKVPIFIKPAPV